MITNTINYNIFLRRTTECELIKDQLSFGDDLSPNILISSKNISKDCNKDLTVKYYAFNGRIFDCNKTEVVQEKNMIILEIIETENGYDLTEFFEVQIMYASEEEKCLKDCEPRGGTCQCPDLSIFEPI